MVQPSGDFKPLLCFNPTKPLKSIMACMHNLMLANGNVPMSLGDLKAIAFSIVSLAKCCL